ncbi:MAG: hypothetical protein AAFQ15_03345 [Pseudomonadota bacterium]
MLDLSRNLFFAHVPKTGGSSIELAHGYRLPKNVLLRHHTAAQMMAHVQAQDLTPPEACFIVVRNIYDRLKSSYRHLQATHIREKGWAREGYTLPAYVQTIIRYFERDEIDVRGTLVYRKEAPRRIAADVRHIERLAWWTDGFDGDWSYLRFENLAAEYARQIAPRTNVSNLPRYNVTTAAVKSLPSDFDKPSLAAIASIYKDEIAQFEMRVPKADQKVRVVESQWRGRQDWRSFLA